MVEIFAQPLVGALCLIVFHIQAVIDSPDHCAWQLGLQVVTSQNSSQQKSSPMPPEITKIMSVGWSPSSSELGPDHPVMLEMFEQPITGAL
jgi:hypothetical protein